MDIASITAAYNGLKVGKEILTGLLEAKIEVESRVKVTEALAKLGVVQDTLFELREELFRLQTNNEELRKQIAQFESWEKQLEKYTLTKTAGGAVVYRFTGEPEHFICPSCVAQRNLQILQDNRTMSGKYRCPGCKNEFPINPQRNPPPIMYDNSPFA
jgi:predicted RNA-binding Zn-ribbon protein involved in translation (DUF1610 family)